MNNSFDFSNCSLSVDTQAHDTYSQLKHVYINVSTPNIPDLAHLEVLKIDRYCCGDNFLVMMDEDEEELAQFSRTLFDKFGRFREELMRNDYHKGSGCWGEEMDYGLLMYISRITVHSAYRHKGIGTWALMQFINSNHVSEDDVVICWPASDVQGAGNTQEEEQRNTEQLDNGIISFFRKNGFRRIGRTRFFGFSPNESHPSRLLSIVEDPDVPNRMAHASVGVNMLLDPARMAQVEQLQQYFPLHAAIFQNMDQRIVEIIRFSYANNPDSIHQRDSSGISPVATAAVRGNHLALTVLLELGVQEDLVDRNNSDSLTPLERCERVLRDSREFFETLVGKWNGYDENILKCRASLIRATGAHIGTDEQFIKQAKWGCSCGTCEDGWLSPRMRHRLAGMAALAYDIASETLGYKKGFMTPETFEDVYGLDFIPMAQRPRYYKRDCRAFIQNFSLIQNNFHSNERPMSLSNPFTDPSLQYAMDFVIHSAKEQSPIGDGSWDEANEDSSKLDHMPTCANDFEFELVRDMIGLPAHIRGPYREDERMSFSDDSDSDLDSWSLRV